MYLCTEASALSLSFFPRASFILAKAACGKEGEDGNWLYPHNSGVPQLYTLIWLVDLYILYIHFYGNVFTFDSAFKS